MRQPDTASQVEQPTEAPQLSQAEQLAKLQAELAEAQRINAELKEKRMGNMRLSMIARPSPKGALAVYGIRRFPITLYAEEWEFVLENQEIITKAIKAHADKLTRKHGGGPDGGED